jgi:hypothetical protein
MKTLVALGFSSLAIPKKIETGRFIVTSMTGNASFTAPSPTLASVTTAINGLETAHITAQGGGADDTAAMYAKELALDLLIKSLGGYVEGIANASPLNAEAIILSAGMNVKNKGVKANPDFDVQITGNPGEVLLIHSGVTRGSIEFQMSTDISNASNWQSIYSGTRGRFTKDGLTSGTRYYFRSTVIDKNGKNPWSPVLNTIVL